MRHLENTDFQDRAAEQSPTKSNSKSPGYDHKATRSRSSAQKFFRLRVPSEPHKYAFSLANAQIAPPQIEGKGPKGSQGVPRNNTHQGRRPCTSGSPLTDWYLSALAAAALTVILLRGINAADATNPQGAAATAVTSSPTRPPLPDTLVISVL